MYFYRIYKIKQNNEFNKFVKELNLSVRRYNVLYILLYCTKIYLIPVGKCLLSVLFIFRIILGFFTAILSFLFRDICWKNKFISV